MSQKIIIGLLSLLFVMLILSCTKELPFPNVEDNPLLVVNSFFSPNDPLIVHLSESCHIQDNNCEGSNVTEAEVKLMSAQGEQLASLEHRGEGIFQADSFQMETSKEYQLEVRPQDARLAVVTCKNSAPSEPIVEFLQVEEGPIDGTNAWLFEVEIDDNLTEENYYLIEGTFDIEGGSHDDGESEINGYIEPHFRHYSEDPNAENKEIGSGIDLVTYALRAVYLTDKNFNGQKYKTTFGLSDWDLPGSGVTADIYIKSVSKEMYEYHKTLDLYRINNSNVFSEPQQVYTNIDNGLGIFAGYSQKHITVELPASEYAMPRNITATDGCTAPCKVSFTTDGGKKLSYSWDFGDGTSSNEPNPEHTYTTAGTYNCFLSVSSGIEERWESDFQVRIN